MSAGQSLTKPNRGSIFFGFVVGAGLTSLAYMLGGLLLFSPATLGTTPVPAALSALSAAILFSLGLVQWIYVLPVVSYFLYKRKTRMATGLLIAALLVAATNCACWLSWRNATINWRF